MKSNGMRFYQVTFIYLIAVVSQKLALGETSDDSILEEWSYYKLQYGKSYVTQEEEDYRLANFVASKVLIDSHNANANNSCKLGLNHMSDWSSNELNQLNGLEVDITRITGNDDLLALISLFDEKKPVPGELDWREVGERVSRVKDQGHCGSCWAFVTTGLLEGQQVSRHFTNKLVPLSEQNLIDCVGRNHGCLKGSITKALNDVSRLPGIMAESAYPYAAQEGTCHFDDLQSIMYVNGGKIVKIKSEDELKTLVASYGPVAVGMIASQNFVQYASGIWEDLDCKNSRDQVKINHAALIVGYGTDAKDGDYWLMKNSWGTNWGEQGYFRIKRGVNMCRIADYVAIAVF